MKKLTRTLLTALCMVLVLANFVSAAVPYSTYIYDRDGKNLISPPAYVPDMTIDANYMGIPGGFTNAADMFVAEDGKLYIADANANRIIVCDRYYKYMFSISAFINDQGVPDALAAPGGLYVDEEYMYVCDTNNNRLVLFDLEGNFKRIIKKPESNLFEEGSIYKPVACVADDYGRVFIVSSTTYQGIIVMNLEGQFFGFIGAEKVSISAFQILWRKLQTEEQREMSIEYVSTEYNNIARDSKNFLYVTTTAKVGPEQQTAITSKASKHAPVKKLNASGADVMRRNGYQGPGGNGTSQILDCAIGPLETYSLIDETTSQIYTYNDQGVMLFAFGDKGNQYGNIESIEAIAYQGNDILALDKLKNQIVVFRRTEYGDVLLKAIENNINMKYDRAVDDWTEILKRNNNFDSAYIEIGKALYRQGKYDEAMEYSKLAYDTAIYSDAYKEVRKEWAQKFFWTIPIVIIVIFFLLSKFMGFTQKVNKRTALKVGRKSLKEELIYAFHVILHPFDGFWDLKHEKRGSVRSGFVILLITVIAYFYNTIGTGYIFNPRPSTAMNIITAISAVVAPLLLWTVANWCLTTLFDGEGSMGDIFTACCYCLTPLPLIMFPVTIASNFLAASEGGIITLLTSLAYIWLGILLFFAMMVTHDYSLFKNILTCLATIVGMAFLMFLGILFTTLLAKIVSFVTNIIEEINYRL